MIDPEQILRKAVGPFLRGAVEGDANQRLGHLERMIAATRAVMRFAREIAPLLAPGTDRETVLRFTAQALAPAVRELIGRAGVDAEQGRVLIAAFALGLEAGAAEPDRPPSSDDTDRAQSLARILEFAQDLRTRGLTREGLRARLDQFACSEGEPDADSSRRESQAAFARAAVDTILTAFFPPDAAAPAAP